jgi:hypothetical protein
MSTKRTGFESSAAFARPGGSRSSLPPRDEFPLRDRTDLPEHERFTPASVLASLQRGIEDAKAGRVKRLDFALLAPDDETE